MMPKSTNLIGMRFSMVPLISQKLKQINIPEGEESLALVAGYLMLRGIWHKRGIPVGSNLFQSPESYDLFISRMGFIPQSNWKKRTNPKLRTESDALPHFLTFNNETIRRIVFVGMWWRAGAQHQNRYWDVNPGQGGGCLLMNANHAVYGGFPIHLSLVETQRKAWDGITEIINRRYPGSRIGFVPMVSYYSSESLSEYIPAIVWPNIADNIAVINDIYEGCRDIRSIFSENGTKQITDTRWESIELLYKRSKQWKSELSYMKSWPLSSEFNIDLSDINPRHGRKTPAAWIFLICKEWNKDISVKDNANNIVEKISKAERRNIKICQLTLMRIVDHYIQDARPRKPYYPRGSKNDRTTLTLQIQALQSDGASILYISKKLGVSERRIYRLLSKSAMNRQNQQKEVKINQISNIAQ